MSMHLVTDILASDIAKESNREGLGKATRFDITVRSEHE